MDVANHLLYSKPLCMHDHIQMQFTEVFLLFTSSVHAPPSVKRSIQRYTKRSSYLRPLGWRQYWVVRIGG
jgi:hypothetical protein